MKTKSKIIILFLIHSTSLVSADVVTAYPNFFLTTRNQPQHLMRATTFIGISDSFMQYHYRGHVGIDDGIFVAIPRKNGKYNGYDYFELIFPFWGAIDGGFAQLPNNPAMFIEQLDKVGKLRNPPYTYDAPVGSNRCAVVPINTFNGEVSYFEATMDRQRRWRIIPALKDGAIIPPGSLFFWWVSGGGNYQLSSSFLNKHPFSKPITIAVKNIPNPGTYEELWYESSDTVTQTVDYCEYTYDEMIEKSLGY